MKKIKVLVVPSDRTGVSYFRSTNPHIALEAKYPNEFHIDVDYEPQIGNDEWLKQYDIIHYHRTFGPYEQMEDMNKKLNELGIVSIMDLDDHWAPGTHHPAYLLIKNAELDKKIMNNLKLAQNITTTTDIFASEISKLNKNVYVLPNAIDPTEKQFTPNLEPSTGRIRIGWLGGSCMTPDTEILTSEGWKRFDKLNQTEKVATLNPNNNELEFHKPTGYICEPFYGDLNCVKNGLIEYEVTPNHNMYVSTVKNLTHKKIDFELIQSEKIHGKNFHVKRDAIWVGEEKETFTLPSIHFELNETESYIDSLITKQSKKINNMFDKYGSDREFKMDEWLEFFGFWLAEGWVSKSKGLFQVGIAQTKKNGYLDYMFTLLTKMGFNPKFTKNKEQLRVFDKQLWEYLSNFGEAPEKFIPQEILSLSPRQLKIFLEWFIKGDGHVENNKYSRTRAFTSSTELANNLQELALKIGVTGTITNRGKRTSSIKGRSIINQYDSLVVNFGKHPSVSKHNKSTPLIKSSEQYSRPYNGNVYCVEVENHIIYVRRNGKPMWIGNSHLKDLEILQGVVSKLKSDGLIDKVQFVLCGFDLRGTHTDIIQVIDPVTNKPIIDPATKRPKTEQKVRNIFPKESVWYQYERIFTADYTSISPEYKDFLLKFKQEEFLGVENEAYRRVWTKNISTYATNYNLFDISLAPLEENIFNKSKSQLKIIESGFHHKAIIAQNFGPYQIDVTNCIKYGGGIDETANGILIDKTKNHKDWYAAIKKLVLNPELVKTLQDNLHETIKDTYSMSKVTDDRRALYIDLVEKQKTKQITKSEIVTA